MQNNTKATNTRQVPLRLSQGEPSSSARNARARSTAARVVAAGSKCGCGNRCGFPAVCRATTGVVAPACSSLLLVFFFQRLFIHQSNLIRKWNLARLYEVDHLLNRENKSSYFFCPCNLGWPCIRPRTQNPEILCHCFPDIQAGIYGLHF